MKELNLRKPRMKIKSVSYKGMKKPYGNIKGDPTPGYKGRTGGTLGKTRLPGRIGVKTRSVKPKSVKVKSVKIKKRI